MALLLGHGWWELGIGSAPAGRELVETWRGTLKDLSRLRRGLRAGERVTFVLGLRRAALEESFIVKSGWDFWTSLLAL